MSGAMERYARVVSEIYREEVAVRLLKLKVPLDTISRATRISMKRILKLQKEMLDED